MFRYKTYKYQKSEHVPLEKIRDIPIAYGTISNVLTPGIRTFDGDKCNIVQSFHIVASAIGHGHNDTTRKTVTNFKM